jgi:ubiquinone/menaquinone biosynthesis C-methylase UbiE
MTGDREPAGPDRRGVRETYERIGRHFSRTRERPWPEVEAFLDGREGRIGLDVGCGNGRHAELLTRGVERVVALDASRALLAEARERARERAFEAALLRGDAAALPLRTARVDLAVYVATLHHLPDEETRRRSLAELSRVLAPGGRALVSVWSTAHDRFDRKRGFDTHVDWTLPGGETVPRFYHIYDPAEFRETLAACPLAVESVEVSSGNCFAVVGPKGNAH